VPGDATARNLLPPHARSPRVLAHAIVWRASPHTKPGRRRAGLTGRAAVLSSTWKTGRLVENGEMQELLQLKASHPSAAAAAIETMHRQCND